MVKLGNVGLSRAYRKNLRDAGADMLRRVRCLGKSLNPSSPPHVVDAWLERAVQQCFEEGERLYWVTIGVLGVQRAFKLSGPLLRGAWKAIEGWRSLKPVKSRVPMTCECLEGLVLLCIRKGWREQGWQRKLWWSCGLALWMGFTCLLRPGEVLNLKIGDLSFPSGWGSNSLDPQTVVVVRSPKTKRIWHRQFVLCSDPRLNKWLVWWVDRQPRGRPLFPLSRYVWTKLFAEGLHDLRLESCRFTLGSLRAGGATNHFRRFNNLGSLQFLGRWSSANTLQFYLQEAFTMHVEAQFSDESRQLLNVLHRFSSLLNSPPTSSLATLFSPV